MMLEAELKIILEKIWKDRGCHHPCHINLWRWSMPYSIWEMIYPIAISGRAVQLMRSIKINGRMRRLT